MNKNQSLTPQQRYDLGNQKYFQGLNNTLSDMNTSLFNVLGMGTYYQDTAKNIGHQFTQTFGDGSFNDPSKVGFWKAPTPASTPIPTKMPMFSDMGSIVTPQPVGTGTVLKPLEMFSGDANVLQGADMGTPSISAERPILPSLDQPQAVQSVQSTVKPLAVTTPGDVTQPKATQMFTSMYGGNPAEAYSAEALASQTAPIEGTADSFNLMEFFGLSDMTGKDMLAGAGAALQTGLGAYGMFKGLGQMDTRLDQGQQQINLSRKEYEENLRHRQAIVAQNKGA